VSLNESLWAIIEQAGESAVRWRSRQDELYALRTKVVTALQDHVISNDIGNLIGRAGESMGSVEDACLRLGKTCEMYRTERFPG
jgi:hypothetical protein